MPAKLEQNKMSRYYSRGKPLDDVVKKEVIKLYEEGMKFVNISKTLKLDRRTVSKIIYNNKAITINENLLIGNKELLNYIDLVVKTSPDIYLDELTEHIKIKLNIKISKSYVCKIVKKKLNYRLKRISHIAKQRNSERVHLLREQFKRKVKSLPIEKFIYIDESSFNNRDWNRRYGYFQPEQSAELEANNYNREACSLILAMDFHKGVRGHFIKNTTFSGVNQFEFIEFLKELVNTLEEEDEEGWILVFDNARIHKSKIVKRWLYDHAIPVLYTAPYSPDLMPIELCFGELKTMARRLKTEESIEDKLVEMISKLSTSNIQRYILHCMYRWKQ